MNGAALGRESSCRPLECGTSSMREQSRQYSVGLVGTSMVKLGQRIVTPRTELSFPVKGPRQSAVMSAIDASGNHLIEYRSIRLNSKWISEIVINPESLTFPQIDLIVAVSSRLIFDFFQTGGGG